MQRVPADPPSVYSTRSRSNFNRQEIFALYRPITVHWCPTLAKIHGFYFYTLKHMKIYISIFTWEAMHRAAKSPSYIAQLHVYRAVASNCYIAQLHVYRAVASNCYIALLHVYVH